MTRIGVRELRRDASRWLARVRAGEVIVITDRGTPVAQLAPIPDRSGYAELCARGRILVAPSHPIDQIVAMLDELAPAEGSLEDALDEMRRDER